MKKSNSTFIALCMTLSPFTYADSIDPENVPFIELSKQKERLSGFPAIQLSDGRTALLAELIASHPDGSVEVRALSSESTDSESVAARTWKLKSVSVVPAIGYAGILGHHAEVVFIIGETMWTQDYRIPGTQGILFGFAAGINGSAEATIGFGLASPIVGYTFAMSYLLDRVNERNLMGLKAAFSLLMLQIKAGLYLDGATAKVVPTAGLGIVFPIEVSRLF